MKPEIRTVDATPVLFVRKTGPYAQAACEAFGVLCGFAGPRGLLGPPARVIGISYDDPQVTEESKLRYDACVTVDREVKPEGEVGLKTIAGGRYAVFLHAGPYESLLPTYNEIFGGWLPGSGQQLRDEPCFEVYVHPVGDRSAVVVPAFDNDTMPSESEVSLSPPGAAMSTLVAP